MIVELTGLVLLPETWWDYTTITILEVSQGRVSILDRFNRKGFALMYEWGDPKKWQKIGEKVKRISPQGWEAENIGCLRNILVYLNLWSKTVHLPFTVQSPIKTLKEDKTKCKALTHTSKTVHSEEILMKGHCGANRKYVHASQPKGNKYTLQWQKQKPLECFASFVLAFRQEIRQLSPQASWSPTIPAFDDRRNSWVAPWTRGFPQNPYPTKWLLELATLVFFPSVIAANSFQLSKITHCSRISSLERSYECSWKATWPSVFLRPQSGDRLQQKRGISVIKKWQVRILRWWSLENVIFCWYLLLL